MKYILYLKDDIVVARGLCKSLDNIELGVYDSYEEVSQSEYNSIQLPSKKINGEWVKADKLPTIEYPKINPVPEQEQEPTADELLNALLGVTSYE